MELTSAVHVLHPRAVFRISRGARAEVRNVFVSIAQDGVVGHGEASPNAFYAESADDVNSKLQRLAPWLRERRVETVGEIAQLWREAWPLLKPSRAAQCALDLAAWDLVAKRRAISVTELAWNARPRAVATFCTIGLSTREELPAKIAEVTDFPWIKIKLDERADLEVVRGVREQSRARLAVDANGAWDKAGIAALSRELAQIGVEFIEQPFSRSQDERMMETLAQSALPIMADESCVVREDVERLAGRFSGFNIKLVKCGGLTPGLAMLQRGWELGLRTMVGCMLESSVLIAAGAVLAQRTDYADLDGAWLLGDDPFDGWNFHHGILEPPSSQGLGVELREIADARNKNEALNFE